MERRKRGTLKRGKAVTVESQKPKAGDRNWAFGGAKKGTKVRVKSLDSRRYRSAGVARSYLTASACAGVMKLGASGACCRCGEVIEGDA